MDRPLVIVGDSMLDVDIEGSATRLSPEAPVPVVDTERVWQRPGGAGLAAVLAARAEQDVVLVTAVGDDADGGALTDLLAHAGVTVLALPMSGTTVCKTRIRAAGQSMLRLDHGTGVAAGDTAPRSVAAAMERARAVCVADYGRGVTAHQGIRELLTRIAARVPVVWDPHPRGAVPTRGCWLVAPNQDEAAGNSPESLRRLWDAKAVCVTLGSRGALLGTADGSTHIAVPGSATRVGAGDTCGAGDRFAIAAAQALGAGEDVHTAVTAAVDAASRFVATGGAVAMSSAAAMDRHRLAVAETELITDDVAAAREQIRRSGRTLVATGGCFDLLHTGHIRLLRQARQLGDALVVLLNSDSSVRALKGPGRPVMAAVDRARVLAALACVDAVVIFDELSPEAALDRLRPDIWVKGGDYTEAELPEAGVVRRHGGEVVLLPTVAGYSSSNLIAAARS